MKKERKDKDFIKSPYFEGGKAAMEAYVKKELRYPKEALAAKIEGTVSVRYTVDYKGKVTEASIISPLSHECDEEALRIVRSLRFKVPNDGKIRSKFTRKLHIHFRLPGSPKTLTPIKQLVPSPAGQAFTYEYQIVQKPVKPSQPHVKKTGSYDFSITIPRKEENS
jgi:protein TonB